MFYYLICTGRYSKEECVGPRVTAKIMKFNSEYDAEKYFIELLNDTEVAFVHTQPSTYNNYSRAEIKTERDMSFGNEKQVRYTKDVNYKLQTNWCKTIII